MTEAELQDEILGCSLAYGRTGDESYLEQIRELTRQYDSRRSMICRISNHAITQYMKRSGLQNKDDAETGLKKKLDRAREVELKDRQKMLINDDAEGAIYLKHKNWILVVKGDTLVTCYFLKAWEKGKVAATTPLQENANLS